MRKRTVHHSFLVARVARFLTEYTRTAALLYPADQKCALFVSPESTEKNMSPVFPTSEQFGLVSSLFVWFLRCSRGRNFPVMWKLPTNFTNCIYVKTLCYFLVFRLAGLQCIQQNKQNPEYGIEHFAICLYILRTHYLFKLNNIIMLSYICSLHFFILTK